jgi:hypothetical protein
MAFLHRNTGIAWKGRLLLKMGLDQTAEGQKHLEVKQAEFEERRAARSGPEARKKRAAQKKKKLKKRASFTEHDKGLMSLHQEFDLYGSGDEDEEPAIAEVTDLPLTNLDESSLLIFVDFESTGKYSKTDVIIQLASMVFGEKKEESFVSFVHTSVAISSDGGLILHIQCPQ